MIGKQQLFILFILIIIGNCQRGGSGSDQHANERWGTDDDFNTKNVSGQESASSYLWLVAFVVGFFSIVYFTYKDPKEIAKQRRIKIQKLFSQWEGKHEAKFLTKSEQEINNFADKLMETKWDIRFQNDNASIMDDGPFKFLTMEKKSSSKIGFSFEIHDNLGRSEGVGLILSCKEGVQLIFEKLYDHRNDAGQTGSFDLLVYKGSQKGEKFKGRWEYMGYENNSQYSGKWQLLPRD